MPAAPAFVENPEPGLVVDLVRFAVMAWPRVRDHHVRSIALLGSVPGEGTTTVTCLLGQVLAAHQGLNVLLCDGNTRNPALADMAGADNSRGWHDAVAAGPQTACVPSRWPNVSVCPYGPAVDAPTDLSVFDGLLERCTTAFDVVLIDCAPLAYMGDALQFARRADAAILVVEADRLSRESVAHGCTTLESLDRPFLGVLLNQHRRPVPNFLYRRV